MNLLELLQSLKTSYPALPEADMTQLDSLIAAEKARVEAETQSLIAEAKGRLDYHFSNDLLDLEDRNAWDNLKRLKAI